MLPSRFISTHKSSTLVPTPSAISLSEAAALTRTTRPRSWSAVRERRLSISRNGLRSKLAALGDPSLFDLVARAKASPRAFVDYLGEPDGSAIIQELESHLSDAERQFLNTAPKKFALG